ncbi:DEAD/DEAH box helicase [Campylobacter rectus]|uniref:DEAD/DEAH box helicase n=1 Tax=Campylobacter rectus TaxID=203 RepID=UPI0023F593CF|nr:DEAD/DEAH box helicase [Campylobacter rectus]
MKFDEKDRVDLKKIGVTTLLDLALKLPKSFEDTSLAAAPKDGHVSIAVEIKSAYSQGGMLHAQCRCEAWGQSVKIVIFNAKPWHYGAFKVGKSVFVSGKCAYAYGSWQLTNPKIVTKINEIIPKYKLSLRDDSFKNLIQKYVNLPNLLATGLSREEVEFLLDLHRGDEKSVTMLEALVREKTGKDVLKFVEIYNYLKKLNAKKTHFKAPKIKLFSISEWLKNLPFAPTSDQLNAIADLRSDFGGERAVRRVVMGDVGSGKTLVMLAAALSVYPGPALIMAPTSILAEQIYAEAVRLLPDFMRIMLIKSGDKPEFDGVNLIIGTHVLLYQSLPAAPLVMIDEQHRFGSNQREKINALASGGLWQNPQLDEAESKFDGEKKVRFDNGTKYENGKNALLTVAKHNGEILNFAEADGKFSETLENKDESDEILGGQICNENSVKSVEKFNKTLGDKFASLATKDAGDGRENLSQSEKSNGLKNLSTDKKGNDKIRSAQKNGVKSVNLCESNEPRAHVVQFSATPIPRTLSMIQSSFAEFSFLRQMPFEKHIHTQILQSADFGELLAHIKAQIAKGRQIAVIYPLVESSESSNYQGLEDAQDFWRANFANVYVTHGKDKEKEQVLREFRERGDVLLSTTVVEVGISLPRLSTIVIVGAERLGLASLHQLRGRVGRNGGSGFCFLFTKLKSPPTRLREFCETLDGFKIAEIDLKNRQSGDILNGAFQHGATFEYYDYEENITQAAKRRLENSVKFG